MSVLNNSHLVISAGLDRQPVQCAAVEGLLFWCYVIRQLTAVTRRTRRQPLQGCREEFLIRGPKIQGLVGRGTSHHPDGSARLPQGEVRTIRSPARRRPCVCLGSRRSLAVR